MNPFDLISEILAFSFVSDCCCCFLIKGFLVCLKDFTSSFFKGLLKIFGGGLKDFFPCNLFLAYSAVDGCAPLCPQTLNPSITNVRNAIDKALAERDSNIDKFCSHLDKDITELGKEVKEVKQEAQVRDVVVVLRESCHHSARCGRWAGQGGAGGWVSQWAM